jgi:ATP-dependent DNA ligase
MKLPDLAVLNHKRSKGRSKMGLEGIVSKRLGSRYRSGRTSDWLKFKNPQAPAVKREAEEDWGKTNSDRR